MNEKLETLELVFTSYRDSMDMRGLKVSLDKHAPKMCSYPALNYLIMPSTRNLLPQNMERICNAILDNNWNLLQDFIIESYDMGVRQLTMCCWCTKEQIAHGKFCPARIIGNYIEKIMEQEGSFRFPIDIKYGDGREVL